MIYVCDTCGLTHLQSKVAGGGQWTCADCGGHAVWEFPAACATAASEHSAHIVAARRAARVSA
jgi:ribosomal protein L37AE/L43A